MQRARQTLFASAAIAAGLATSGPGHAQAAGPPDVVVTAERTPGTTLTEAPDAYVITDKDIQAAQAMFAADGVGAPERALRPGQHLDFGDVG